MRHLNLSYSELSALPDKKVWRLYAMLVYELEERQKEERRATGQMELKPPHKN